MEQSKVEEKDLEGTGEEKPEPIVKPKNDSVMESYVPAANERHLIHAEMEVVSYNQSTGKKLSVPMIQKFNTKEWPQIEKTAPQQGYTIKILFDPRKK